MRALNGISAPNSFKLLGKKIISERQQCQNLQEFYICPAYANARNSYNHSFPLLINIYLVGAKCINEPSILLMAVLPLILNPFALSFLSLTCRGL